MDQTTVELGASAEQAAARLLECRGYRIVERNFRCKAGELDLVALDRDVLVFVEVRSRTDPGHGHAAEMVGPRKQRQVARVAAYYLAARATRTLTYDRVRFDVVAVTAGVAELIVDAWRPE